MIDREFFTTAVNHAPDPGFESGTRQHTAQSSAVAGVTPDLRVIDTPTITGAYSLLVAQTADTSGTNGVRCAHGVLVPVQPTEVWSIGVQSGYVTSGFGGRVTADFLTDALAVTGAAGTAVTPNGQVNPGWLYVNGMTAPANAVWLRVRLQLDRLAAAANVAGRAIFDDLTITRSPTALKPFNGDEGGADWLGARFWSPSQRIGEAQTLQSIKDLVPPYWYSEPVS